jgi:hypothetical protein
VKWLDDGTDHYVRVTLGPGESYFAWDRQRIRWEGIPNALQSSIQSWFGPTGWVAGPPRIVCLGYDESYFAVSEYGAAAWRGSPDSQIERQFNRLGTFHADGTFDFGDLQVSLLYIRRMHLS